MSCRRAPEQHATAFEKAGIAGTPELASFIARAESIGATGVALARQGMQQMDQQC